MLQHLISNRFKEAMDQFQMVKTFSQGDSTHTVSGMALVMHIIVIDADLRFRNLRNCRPMFSAFVRIHRYASSYHEIQFLILYPKCTSQYRQKDPDHAFIGIGEDETTLCSLAPIKGR